MKIIEHNQGKPKHRWKTRLQTGEKPISLKAQREFIKRYLSE